MTTAIQLSEVSKYYKLYHDKRDRLKEALHPFGKEYHTLFYALRDIDLEINKGEIVGVVGRNGSGKSTLLKLISHVLQPNSGEVRVNGKVSALLELGSGFNPEFSGLENIFFYATILGLTKSEINEKLDAIVEFADIGEFLTQPLKSYSSGMKSRLGFSVAVHIEPEILILDEVLAVGDVLFQRKCFAKMEELFRSGKTIVYVSHDSNSINQLCTRAIFLDDGKLVMDGKPKEVTAYYQKYSFAKQTSIEALREEIQNQNAAATRESSNLYYLETLQSDARMEFRNRNVDISGEKILDESGNLVNVLTYGRTYYFEVNVTFGTPSADVSFGLELKDMKGVLVTSVESAQLHKFRKSFSDVGERAQFKLRYQFECWLTTGTYLLNFGVSSYTTSQEVLNRIIDIYMFKVENNTQYSAGPVQFIKNVEVASSEDSGFVPLIRAFRPTGS